MNSADIACVVLASGLSERFGAADKLSADLCGRSVLSHVLETAKEVGFREVFVVSQRRGGNGYTWVRNDNPSLGQGHALRLGLEAARGSGLKGFAIMLGDMPLVISSYMEKLIRKYDYNQSIVSVSESIRMPPAIFNAESVDMILSRKTVLGARGVFDLIQPVTMEMNSDAALDVDTPADLARVASIMKARNI